MKKGFHYELSCLLQSSMPLSYRPGHKCRMLDEAKLNDHKQEVYDASKQSMGWTRYYILRFQRAGASKE